MFYSRYRGIFYFGLWSFNGEIVGLLENDLSNKIHFEI
jgi:hypothetical protein